MSYQTPDEQSVTPDILIAINAGIDNWDYLDESECNALRQLMEMACTALNARETRMRCNRELEQTAVGEVEVQP